MALVTRYFDISGAGSQDGTSYANRAPLIVSGAFNTIITGFNFTGSDALECVLEPGIYTGLTTNMIWSPLGNAPSLTKNLFFRTANFVPPRWVSAQPFWDKSNMARIQCASNIFLGIANTNWFGISIEFSNRNAAIFPNVIQRTNWCLVENSTNGTSASCYSSASVFTGHNSGFKCSGTSYDAVVNPANSVWTNCRFEGNLSASSGNRWGVRSGANPGSMIGCTICNNVGESLLLAAATGAMSAFFLGGVIYGADNGIRILSSDTTTQSRVDSSFIVSTGGSSNGIDIRVETNSLFRNNRIRVGGTPIVNQIDYPSAYNDISAGSDAEEFVDATNGDFRIKKSSIYWGKGIGAGDEGVSGNRRGGAFAYNIAYPITW